jgi:hypothetical protein
MPSKSDLSESGFDPDLDRIVNDVDSMYREQLPLLQPQQQPQQQQQQLGTPETFNNR